MLRFMIFFEARHRRIGLDEDFDMFNGTAFPDEDRAGRYVFRDGTALPPENGGLNGGRNGRISASLIELRNVIGVSAGRVLPTVTRIEMGANHSDYWYNGNRGLVPNSRDSAYALAQSERENLRFRPFASYRTHRFNYDPDWNHEVRGGMSVPITDNVDASGEAGYHWSDNLARNVTIWRGRIRHTPGPLTFHQFEYFREVTEPVRDLEETYYYQFKRIIGPYLFGEAYASHSTFVPLDRADLGSIEDRIGVRFSSELGLRTTARAGFVHSNIRIGKPRPERVEAWRARFELSYRHSQDIQWLLTYQYQIVDSTRPTRSYEENLVILTLTKYF